MGDEPNLPAGGRGVLSFRMYPNALGEWFQGWTKAFASGAGQTACRTLLRIVGCTIGLMLAPLGLLVTAISSRGFAKASLAGLDPDYLRRFIRET